MTDYLFLFVVLVACVGLIFGKYRPMTEKRRRRTQVVSLMTAAVFVAGAYTIDHIENDQVPVVWNGVLALYGIAAMAGCFFVAASRQPRGRNPN